MYILCVFFLSLSKFHYLPVLHGDLENRKQRCKDGYMEAKLRNRLSQANTAKNTARAKF